MKGSTLGPEQKKAKKGGYKGEKHSFGKNVHKGRVLESRGK